MVNTLYIRAYGRSYSFNHLLIPSVQLIISDHNINNVVLSYYVAIKISLYITMEINKESLKEKKM